MLKKLTLAFAALACLATTSNAAPVYGTDVGPANYTGSRSLAAGELVAGGNYATDPLVVSWVVTYQGGVDWLYEYTFAGFGPPAVSHFILDLTDDAVIPVVDSDVVRDETISSGSFGQIEYGTFGPGPSNPGFPAGSSIVGVKFNTNNPSTNSFTVTFLSNRAPVWGDIYFKGGNDSFAYNKGLPNHLSEDIRDFIARPNGIVPEPGSIALVGLGLGTIGLMGLRRRNRSKA